MPNAFAYIALLSWPLVVFLLFRSLPRSPALIWSIVGGYLLLPYAVGVKITGLPVFDKDFIPAATAGLLCLFAREDGATSVSRESSTADPARPVAPERAAFTRQREVQPVRAAPVTGGAGVLAGRRPPGAWIANALLLLALVTPVITVLQNGEPALVGARLLPGLQLYDAASMLLGTFASLLPFLLARRYLATPERHVMLLRILCIAGLLYTLPTLFEIRMSPQLSRWIYGFLAQEFQQAMRDGGFRPVVFLQHGLWLAIFLAMTTLAAAALWREARAAGRPSRWLLAAAWLFGTLALCHSFGALVIAALLGPVVLLAPVRGQTILAAAVAVIILGYPMLRGAGMIPTAEIASVAETISPDRAQSLEFRFRNEDILLARAELKPLAGWGGWGRSRVYDDKSGKDISTTDGMWIITIGVSGWLGYLAQFGLLALPLVLLALFRRVLDPTSATAGLGLVLAANLIDLIPNATLTPVTWLVAGALTGFCGIARVRASADATRAAAPRRAVATAQTGHRPAGVGWGRRQM